MDTDSSDRSTGGISSPKKILVVGASGQVGGALMELAGPGAIGTFLHTPFPGGMFFDLEAVSRNPSMAEDLLGSVGANAVIIAAGFTNVEAGEHEPDRMFVLNRDSPTAMAKIAHAVGARTVYFSTEYVFDGLSGPYAEDDPCNPLSVYGKSKLEGERAVQEADPSALIIRTTVVYGPEVQGKNFAYRLAGSLAAGRRICVPCDQVSSPTYNRDLASSTLSLLESGAHGVFHVAGPEVMDRAVFARRLARALNLDEKLIDPTATNELGQSAPRPLVAGLKIDKLREAMPGTPLRTVEQSTHDWQSHPRGRPLLS